MTQPHPPSAAVVVVGELFGDEDNVGKDCSGTDAALLSPPPLSFFAVPEVACSTVGTRTLSGVLVGVGMAALGTVLI